MNYIRFDFKIDKFLKSNIASHSDPIYFIDKNIDYRIKGTLGITGLWLLRVPIDGVDWHLDVGSSYPGWE